MDEELKNKNVLSTEDTEDPDLVPSLISATSVLRILLLSFVLGLPSSISAAEPAGVSGAEMQRVYEEVKTPFKYGIILRGGENELLDCPSVFRFGEKWFMVYIAIRDNVG